jgi:putative cardiolipin synthase
LQQLADQVRAANSEVLLVSPYLIPGQKGVAFWRSIVEQGVRVVMLTNSLASNHQKIAHSAYARYRKDLLEAGVELYEVRADMVPRESSAETASLHIKGMVIDRRRTFIGSPNYDPRSLAINSEMLLIIDSTDLGSQLAGDVMQSLPELAYRVELDAKGKLQWRSEIDGVEAIEKSEPLAGPWLRFQAQLFRIVPETQL